LSLVVSIIVCTYGRTAALRLLLDCLNDQNYRDFEVLIVDGNQGDRSPAQDTLEKFLRGDKCRSYIRLIKSQKGLTRQRNVGLAEAKGDLICFLDDDVSVAPDFLEKVIDIFLKPEAASVGGLTGYDPLNYSSPVMARWRLKKLLGAIPSLTPGDVDHLGRAVPVSFLNPWAGHREIGWLPGFCMIYRRQAIDGLRFDEKLPTYGGEDRDFSMYVGSHWRLWICGDLKVNHHGAQTGRDSHLERIYQTGFGTARRFAKNARTPGDYARIFQTFLGDFLVDLLGFLGSPTYLNWMAIFVRIKGSCAGWSSCEEKRPYASQPSRQVPLEAETRSPASLK
jgi:glycosyltransferase involved in cell wall biosynthesis